MLRGLSFMLSRGDRIFLIKVDLCYPALSQQHYGESERHTSFSEEPTGSQDSLKCDRHKPCIKKILIKGLSVHGKDKMERKLLTSFSPLQPCYQEPTLSTVLLLYGHGVRHQKIHVSHSMQVGKQYLMTTVSHDSSIQLICSLTPKDIILLLYFSDYIYLDLYFSIFSTFHEIFFLSHISSNLLHLIV